MYILPSAPKAHLGLFVIRTASTFVQAPHVALRSYH